MKRVFCLSAILCCLLLGSCSGSSSNNGTAIPATPTPESAAAASSDIQPQSPKAQIDPCSLFRPEDAQAIVGVPMKLVPGHGAIVCMYEEASPKPGLDTARMSLMLNETKSVEQEAKEWNNTKELRRLTAGEKNITQLTGIGDEAWFDGHAEKGKVGVGGILVRKGKTNFALESAVLQYRASLERMKEISHRIADKLQ
ncbi:MAG TPA: hypothetical protein VGP89_03580 [Candidatus Angelobacter sp.]|jgi:hypothetical protein|nr:hypothetical protein [Candidatus Angelobacter sp.]